MKLKSILAFLIVHLTMIVALQSQSYFKVLEQPESSYFQRLAQFSNGHILISDRPGDPLNGNINKGIYLIRMDECGEVVWSNRYFMQSPKIDIYEIAVNEADEIFVFGGAILGSKKHIFLGKFTENGAYISHKILDGASNANFTYSMSLYDDGLLISGLLFETNANKPYYILKTDFELNIISTAIYLAPKGYGECIATSDGGALFSTIDVITKVAANGAVEWSKEFIGATAQQSVFIPLEVDDGFIFQSFYEGLWFFKLGLDSSLMWQSKQCAANYYQSEMLLLENGDFLGFYVNQGIVHFTQVSAQGEILNQYQLQVDFYTNAGFLDPVIYDNNRVNVVGNVEMNFQEANSLTDFVLQFELDNLEEECRSWEIVNTLLPELVPFEMANYTMPSATASVMEISSSPMITEVQNVEFLEVCDIVKREAQFAFEAELPCEESWMVEVPLDSLTWSDGNTDNPRQLVLPGIYTASYEDCLEKQEYIYTLTKNDCGCNAYLPNAFSPNFDGKNDELGIYTNCTIAELSYAVYDRWGELVFYTEIATEQWDGNFKGHKAQMGVYVVRIEATLIDLLGNSSAYEISQSVALIR